MSYAPDTIVEVQGYLHKRTKLTLNALGIVGGAGHTYGYHLGADRLPRKDYSNDFARDRAGLSNAASALDIGDFPKLRALTAHLVRLAQAGKLPDVREIIGPGPNGRAYRWAWELRYEPRLRAFGDDHEWHTHISYWRDSERRSKLAPFREFFEGDGSPTPRPPTPSWTETAMSNLPTLRKGANGQPVKNAQGLLHAHGHRQSAIDGDYGPKTVTAVKAFQRRHRLDDDGIIGRRTWTKLLGV